jgi:hypothetical protein
MQHRNELEPCTSHRGSITSRLKQAESGNWIPLIEELLQAHVNKDPNKEAKEALWPTKCMRAASRSLAGGWAVAFRALHSDTCPPPNEDTFNKVASKFRTDTSPPQTASELQRLCASTLLAGNRKADAKVTLAKVDKRLRSLKRAAMPGNAKGKNTHLSSLLKAPYGKHAMRMWALAWIKGEVPQVAVDIWTKGFVKPLSKKGGSGVRPISLFETCLKVATGVALDVSKRDVVNAVGTFQYGALLSAGADKMVYNLRALAIQRPSHVFVATDIANAFGNVPRLRALKAILKHVPFLAPILSLLWRAPFTSLLVPKSIDVVDELEVTEGVFQGECLSTAVFCIFLRSVIDDFFTSLQSKLGETVNAKQAVTILAYVDDVVLSFDPAHIDVVWNTWVEVLAANSLKVEPSKCKAWVPANRDIDHGIQVHVPVVTDGLPVLGTAAQAGNSTLITVPDHPIPLQRIVADAHSRLLQTDADADLLVQMVETKTEQPMRYAAWLMLVRSLAVRMDFDMRILPAEVLSPLILHLTATLLRTARSILGLPHLSDIMLAQAQAPGQFGGMFLTNPFIKLQVAHLASMAASWKHTFHWLQSRGVPETQAFTSIDTTHATFLLEDLHTSNIWLNVFGAPCTGQHPDRLFNLESPLLLEIKTLQGRLTNVLYDLQAKTIWSKLDIVRQTRLLSASGTGNGAMFRSPTKMKTLHLDDYEFQICAALRLGHPVPGLGICRNRTQNGRMCGADADQFHPLSCKVGGGVAMLHTAVCMQLNRIFKTTGAQVKREVPIPEFANRITSAAPTVYDPDDADPRDQAHLAAAIMDVVAYLPTGEEFLFDASVRNPLAKRYAVAAFSKFGFAADCGEQDKRQRYPPAQGKKVEPCVIESFGRLGTHFLLVLDQAVHLSAKYNSDLTGNCRNQKDEWLIDLSATICKTIARNYRNSIIGSQMGDPPVHTLFPAPPQDPHPLARLHVLQSPLTTVQNNVVRRPVPADHAPQSVVWPDTAMATNGLVTSSPLSRANDAQPPESPGTEPNASPGTLAVRLLRRCALELHMPSLVEQASSSACCTSTSVPAAPPPVSPVHPWPKAWAAAPPPTLVRESCSPPVSLDAAA